jgi:hypothetical protein
LHRFARDIVCVDSLTSYLTKREKEDLTEVFCYFYTCTSWTLLTKLQNKVG